MKSLEKSTLFIFPGQGSQYVGMGKDLFDNFAVVRSIYQEANEALGYDIAKLSFEDPKDEINYTRYTQPALLTHSIACLKVFNDLSDKKISPEMTGGHSLGEYSALVAAGALDFSSAIQLVSERGRLMSELGTGEMEALSISLSEAQKISSEFFCGVCACNLPDQTVVGGQKKDLDSMVKEINLRYPQKKTSRLKTEGAFHTFYMTNAALAFRDFLSDTPFSTPHVEVLSNFSGGFHDPNPDRIRSSLFAQLINPVLWNKNLLHAYNNGCQKIIEFGGGIGKNPEPSGKKPNLASIVKKTFRRQENGPEYYSVISTESLTELVNFFESS